MDEAALADDSNLRLVLSTWVYRLHAAGIDPDDDVLREQCAAVDAAQDDAAGDEAGMGMVRRIADLLDDGEGPGAVLELARDLYGDRVDGSLGEGDRAERTTRIRKYQFGRSLPWLARIYDRYPDGEVAPCWLLVEQVTDEVQVMDPNPWNDIDERRHIPLGDFHVLWELDGCTAVGIS